MLYTKPEVVRLSDAAKAIQGNSKVNGTNPDGIHPLVTSGAYEADE